MFYYLKKSKIILFQIQKSFLESNIFFLQSSSNQKEIYFPIFFFYSFSEIIQTNLRGIIGFKNWEREKKIKVNKKYFGSNILEVIFEFNIRNNPSFHHICLNVKNTNIMSVFALIFHAMALGIVACFFMTNKICFVFIKFSTLCSKWSFTYKKNNVLK